MSRLIRRARAIAARVLGRGDRRTPIPADPRFPNWQAILDSNRPLWDEARRRAASGPGVLVATSFGGYAAGSIFESLLSVALTLRGAKVHTLLCDRALPACQRAEHVDLPDPMVLVNYELPLRLCDSCYATGRYHYDPLGLTDHRVGQLTTRAEKLEARRIATETPAEKIRDLHLGGHGRSASTPTPVRCATTRGGDLDAEPLGEHVLRRYLEASLLMADASTPPDPARGHPDRRLQPRPLRAAGRPRRGLPQSRRPGRELEPGLPDLLLHLQPRRHLPSHPDGRADRGLGGRCPGPPR